MSFIENITFIIKKYWNTDKLLYLLSIKATFEYSDCSFFQNFFIRYCA
jgi:hypothetical protein